MSLMLRDCYSINNAENLLGAYHTLPSNISIGHLHKIHNHISYCSIKYICRTCTHNTQSNCTTLSLYKIHTALMHSLYSISHTLTAFLAPAQLSSYSHSLPHTNRLSLHQHSFPHTNRPSSHKHSLPHANRPSSHKHSLLHANRPPSCKHSLPHAQPFSH